MINVLLVPSISIYTKGLSFEGQKIIIFFPFSGLSLSGIGSQKQISWKIT